MQFEPFQMERWQSLHEHEVEINLSDSGVHPVALRELASEEELQPFLYRTLGYTQTNGTPELRGRIAALYPAATPEHVLVTSGGAEANFLVAWSLIEPGDEVVCMLPNYMQLVGLARSFGAEVRGWPLEPDLDGGRWTVDLARLDELVTERTRFVAICNPNNPTGRRLSEEELDGVIAVARRAGAWLLSDEVYHGSELDGRPTTSVLGRYERALVTNSLSKAYGLPGLRLGWIAGEPGRVAELWAGHDYTTIAPAALSDDAARIALREPARGRLLERTRRILKANYSVVSAWLAKRADTLRHIRPEAGAMFYVRYAHGIGSTELAERLRAEKSVLIVPGDHYGMDRWLRIGFGGETAEIEAGLVRLGELLDEIGA